MPNELEICSDSLEMLRENPKNIALHNKSVNAHYDREHKSLVVELTNDSAGIRLVYLLEIVRYNGSD